MHCGPQQREDRFGRQIEVRHAFRRRPAPRFRTPCPPYCRDVRQQRLDTLPGAFERGDDGLELAVHDAGSLAVQRSLGSSASVLVPLQAVLPCRMIRPLLAGLIASSFLLIPSVAAAQAKGSADAAAARRVDPKWKAPRLPWGHPDLEGIWTTDDMRGVPMSRQAQYGTRMHLTDEEFAARARQRNAAREIDDARTGTFRNEEGSRDFSYTSMVVDPPDGRVP